MLNERRMLSQLFYTSIRQNSAYNKLKKMASIFTNLLRSFPLCVMLQSCTLYLVHNLICPSGCSRLTSSWPSLDRKKLKVVKKVPKDTKSLLKWHYLVPKSIAFKTLKKCSNGTKKCLNDIRPHFLL